MDSTISVQPAEAPDSLLRARRAAWGSFAGAVVDSSLWHYRRAGV